MPLQLLALQALFGAVWAYISIEIISPVASDGIVSKFDEQSWTSQALVYFHPPSTPVWPVSVLFLMVSDRFAMIKNGGVAQWSGHHGVIGGLNGTSVVEVSQLIWLPVGVTMELAAVVANGYSLNASYFLHQDYSQEERRSARTLSRALQRHSSRVVAVSTVHTLRVERELGGTCNDSAPVKPFPVESDTFTRPPVLVPATLQSVPPFSPIPTSAKFIIRSSVGDIWVQLPHELSLCKRAAVTAGLANSQPVALNVSAFLADVSIWVTFYTTSDGIDCSEQNFETCRPYNLQLSLFIQADLSFAAYFYPDPTAVHYAFLAKVRTLPDLWQHRWFDSSHGFIVVSCSLWSLEMQCPHPSLPHSLSTRSLWMMLSSCCQYQGRACPIFAVLMLLFARDFWPCA
jgi:hypothetical protein